MYFVSNPQKHIKGGLELKIVHSQNIKMCIENDNWFVMDIESLLRSSTLAGVSVSTQYPHNRGSSTLTLLSPSHGEDRDCPLR